MFTLRELKSEFLNVIPGGKFLIELYYKYKYSKLQKHIQSEVLQYLTGAGADKDILELEPFFRKHYFDKEHYFNMIPYEWVGEFAEEDIEVHFDNKKRLYYVYWRGKKMYWKRGIRPLIIQKCANVLFIEQDDRSPHKYVLTDTLKGAVIADLGGAEGCFTLDVIEQIEHAYIFECDEKWIEALEATFEPYKEKVTIIKKFVGKDVNENCTTLDEYFSDKKLDYLKADIEGAEVDMLWGGIETMKHKVREANICLYHTPTDESNIIDFLTKCDYLCQVTDGYIFLYDEQVEPRNWFRRGVVLGKRL